MSEMCQFCPAGDCAPATRFHTDPQGYRYRLCDRHYRPIGEWLEWQHKSKGGKR